MRITFITVILSAFMLSACGSKETAQTPAPKAELPAFERAPVFKAALDYNAVSRIEAAKAMDAPLMVIFGFNKCPYCIKLESEIMDPRNPLRSGDVAQFTEMANAAGWHRVWSPFVVFVNPKTGEMTSESKWEAKEIYCDWAAGVATSLEKVGMAEVGEPKVVRERCPKT